MINLGVLGSTKGTDLQAIINAISEKRLNAKISVVISNNSQAFILKRAQKHGLPTKFISHTGKDRNLFDSEITLVLKKYNVEIVLLIGFMRILSSNFCKEWDKRIINVHPSLLPKYSGGMDTNIHEQVLKNGDKETGCTIHFVTSELDAGPILMQSKCQVKSSDTVDTLKERVQQLEGELFIDCINQLDTSLYE